MTLPTNEIIRALPGLRRYACALTGSTQSGDAYIRVALEALVEEPWRLPPEGEVKPELYGLFHRALQICNFQELSSQAPPEAHSDLHHRLLQLSLVSRKLLLLVDLEDFPVDHAAELLRLSESEAEWRLATARHALRVPPPSEASRANGRRTGRRWVRPEMRSGTVNASNPTL